MPPGLSPTHLLVIFVVALIVLGPDKMPDAIRKGARLLGEARQWSARISEEVENVVSMQTQDVMAPPVEHSWPGGDDDDTSTQLEPTTTDASAPDAPSTSSGPGSSDIGPSGPSLEDVPPAVELGDGLHC